MIPPRYWTLCALACVMAVGACRLERVSPEELVYSITPATWFEDGWSYYAVSPDQSSAIFGARFAFQFIDLTQKRTDASRVSGPLTEVTRATFRGDGGIARLGKLDDTAGWFVGDGDSAVRTPLPPSATPVWSPDGATVAFYFVGDGRVVVSRPEGEWEHTFDGFATGIGWAPEGDIVYALVDHPDGLSELIRVNVESGAIDTVVAELDATARFSSIAVSPDGGPVYLALAGGAPPDPDDRHRPEAQRNMDIYAWNPATAGLEAVVQTPGDDFHPLLRGRYLYWTHNDQSEDIVAVPIEGGDVRVVIEDGQIPYWSADGRQIAFTVGGWGIANWALNLDVAVVDVDVEARRVSDPAPLVVGYHEDFTPAWSPDGRWLAYHSHRSETPVAYYAAEGATDDIYVRRPDAPFENEIRLTDFGWEVGMADWSPDGRRLVFDSWERGGEPGVSKPWIATIDPEFGRLVELQRLPLPDGVKSSLLAAWSPLGGEIALVERIEGQRQALWILGVDGEVEEKLLEFEASTYGGVDWTPDGQNLVYAGLVDGRMQLFSVDRSSGEPRQLTNDATSLVQPQVSPDGRWIAATRLNRSKELRRRSLR